MYFYVFQTRSFRLQKATEMVSDRGKNENEMRNGPFRKMIQSVSRCETYRFIMQNGLFCKSKIGLSGWFLGRTEMKKSDKSLSNNNLANRLKIAYFTPGSHPKNCARFSADLLS